MDLKGISREIIIRRFKNMLDSSLFIFKISLTASQSASVLGTLCVVKLLIFGLVKCTL